MRPAPMRVGSMGERGVVVTVYASWLAVFIASALSCAGVHVGWSWRSSAITPAVIGEAMEVPLFTEYQLPVPMPVEKMFTPGAPMSGFRFTRPCWRDGPRELK